MKRRRLRYGRLILGLILALLVSQADAQKAGLKSQKEKVSYVIGLGIGKNFKQQSMDIDPDAFARGLRDALSGASPLLTDQEINEVMAAYKTEMAAKQNEWVKKVGDKNKKDGEAFLSENRKKLGVKVLPSGLQYRVLQTGTGNKPKVKDTVIVHYRGTLVNGAEFDSTYRRGRPASFSVSGVIAGWTEALQMMTVGSKWELFVPYRLAYGEVGKNPIEPFAALIFEIELLGIQEPGK